MAITETEDFGYVSAGCVDGDIIYQARECLKTGQPRTLVYGEGSPFKDIALPCGGTIHISIFPNPDKDRIKQIIDLTEARKTATLILPGLSLDYAPKIKLRIVGRGAPFSALSELAHNSGFLVHGQSPQPDLNRDYFERFDHLKSPRETPDVKDDLWSAVIFLFHDHDWEPHLLTQALAGDSFYIGAMGSERTHAQRLASLEELGAENTDRIRGPIGLIPAMRDAQRLAVSVLAEIIDAAQTQGQLS